MVEGGLQKWKIPSSWHNFQSIFYILEFMKPRYDAREFGVLKSGGTSKKTWKLGAIVSLAGPQLYWGDFAKPLRNREVPKSGEWHTRWGSGQY